MNVRTAVCPGYDLSKAKQMIEQAGIKATDKRTKLLSMMISEEFPLSAYEIMDKFNLEFGERVVANSIYRMLECLTKWRLVHRLASINKYIACTGSSCNLGNYYSVFIICGGCQKTHESPASNMLIGELKRSVEKTSFGGVFSQIELKGLCENCRSKQPD